MSQKPQRLEKDIVKRIKMDYLLYLPEDYGKTENKWPLILFLHGAGESGNDIEIVKRNGIPKVAEQLNLQFVCISPQCPDGSYWEEQLEELETLIDDVIEKYDIDKDRIYVTGLSMGGYGTWSFAAVNNDKIAAMAPICGGGSADYAEYLKGIPIWVFHGVKDDIVPIEESKEMVKTVRDAGGDVTFTVYEDAGHDSWTSTYLNQKLYEWFLSNKRK